MGALSEGGGTCGSAGRSTNPVDGVIEEDVVLVARDWHAESADERKEMEEDIEEYFRDLGTSPEGIRCARDHDPAPLEPRVPEARPLPAGHGWSTAESGRFVPMTAHPERSPPHCAAGASGRTAQSARRAAKA